MNPKIIVHGGAWNIPKQYHQAHMDGCYQAIEVVISDLKNGLDSLTAVEKAVNVLEEDETFNAGRGSYLNAIGEIELDAIICDGKTLNFGAVAAVQNILHPVSAAKLILEHPEHSFLVGKGVQQFLREKKIPEIPIAELLTEREFKYYQAIKSDPRFRTRMPFEDSPMDTVGAVAVDAQGNFAAATSTGGTPRKLPGRAGDSPVIGAGAYADNESGAVSATGYGEAIMKVLLSKTVCEKLKICSPMEAARQGIAILEKRVDGLGGIVGINLKGKYAYAHNTPYMAFAYYQENRGIISQIKINDPPV